MFAEQLAASSEITPSAANEATSVTKAVSNPSQQLPTDTNKVGSRSSTADAQRHKTDTVAKADSHSGQQNPREKSKASDRPSVAGPQKHNKMGAVAQAVNDPVQQKPIGRDRPIARAATGAMQRRTEQHSAQQVPRHSSTAVRRSSSDAKQSSGGVLRKLSVAPRQSTEQSTRPMHDRQLRRGAIHNTEGLRRRSPISKRQVHDPKGPEAKRGRQPSLHDQRYCLFMAQSLMPAQYRTVVRFLCDSTRNSTADYQNKSGMRSNVCCQTFQKQAAMSMLCCAASIIAPS